MSKRFDIWFLALAAVLVSRLIGMALFPLPIPPNLATRKLPA